MSALRPRLGVNIDHVATLRQVRGTPYPEPVLAAQLAELEGADQITVHLREDRRHIQDRDVRLLRAVVQRPLNLEMANTPEMLAFALEVRPDIVTVVPERREERTTEGGLDCCTHESSLRTLARSLTAAGIEVSLFIAADSAQIQSAHRIGAHTVELHTGDYAHGASGADAWRLLEDLRRGAGEAAGLGLAVAAGHGLDARNLMPLLEIPEIEEFNIGHSVVARAVFVGFPVAVRECLAALGPGAPRPRGGR